MRRILPFIIIALVVLGVAQNPLFVVNEGEQALVTEFGKPVGGVLGPGLHVRIPFIQTVHRFETRILKWDGDPNQIPTKDKRYIFLDTTARWRISDPLLFFKTVASERGAQGRLDDIIDSVVRDAVSGHLLVELVRGSDYQAPAAPWRRFSLKGWLSPPNNWSAARRSSPTCSKKPAPAPRNTASTSSTCRSSASTMSSRCGNGSTSG
ncbi:MAG: SPFH domain-containing protein [Syntrophotaleaceae bacterium]